MNFQKHSTKRKAEHALKHGGLKEYEKAAGHCPMSLCNAYWKSVMEPRAMAARSRRSTKPENCKLSQETTRRPACLAE